MSSGSTDIQVRTLRRRFDLAQNDFERAQIAEQLLPRVTTSLKGEEQMALLEQVVNVEPPGLAGRIHGLRAIAAAISGLDLEIYVAAAIEIADKVGPEDRSAIYDRIGYAYQWQGDYQRSDSFILESMRLAKTIGDNDRVAHGASVLGYSAMCRGDYDTALHYAQVACTEGKAADNAHLVVWGLIAQYDILTSLGRWEEARVIQRAFQGLASDRDMRDFGFAKAIHDAELLAIDGDFAGAVRRLESLGSIEQIGSRAHALALVALFQAGLGEDNRARTEARRAFSLASLPIPKDDPNKFAREQSASEATLVASYVLTLVGATYKGTRALVARKNLSGHLGPLARMLAQAATKGIGRSRVAGSEHSAGRPT